MNSPHNSSPLDLSNPDRFSEVFAEHERGVYSAALRVTGNPTSANDVVQDVFLRLWRKPDRFDPKRGEIGPFLKLMARSRALDLWREGDASSRATDRYKTTTEYEPPRVEARPEIELEISDERTKLRSVVRELPDLQREAVVLAYWAGLTSEEIAAKAGVPVGTAKSRVRLGVNRLRETCAPELAAA
ncbi:MAG: sigma-70 family RNA polymerase sigma factor [Solirubrobacterales bacterium]|nr:sigma-70 family RNA polymerase sigma factor [Solirubrobacterales bacterium]